MDYLGAFIIFAEACMNTWLLGMHFRFDEAYGFATFHVDAEVW